MYNVNAISEARSIVNVSAKVGAKLPASVLDAHERAARIAHAAQAIGRADADIIAAVTEALDAGVDPACDENVRRITTAAAIANPGISKGVEQVVGNQLQVVFASNVEGIFAAWRKPFEKAAAVVVTAHERIGDHELGDTAAILRLGDDVARVWADAQDAVAVLDAIAAGWQAVAIITGSKPHAKYRALRIANATADQWAGSDLERNKSATAWDIALGGLVLDLADAAEYERRVGTVSQRVPALEVVGLS